MSITTTRDGEIIEGRTGTSLHIGHNNVTIRGCGVTPERSAPEAKAD